MNEWVSVEERLPEESGIYITYSEYKAVRPDINNCIASDYFDAERGFWLNDGGGQYVTTHWMPLPDPPKENK